MIYGEKEERINKKPWYFRLVGIEVINHLVSTIVVLAALFLFGFILQYEAFGEILGSVFIIIIIPAISFIISCFSIVARAAVLVNSQPFIKSLKCGITDLYKAAPSFFPGFICVLLATYSFEIRSSSDFEFWLFLILFPISSYLFVRLSLVPFVWYENKKMGMRDIIKKSFTLVKGRTFWSCFAISFLMFGILISAPEEGEMLFRHSISVAIFNPILWYFLHNTYTYKKAKK